MGSDQPSLRLCPSVNGQLASPLQSVWVGSCLMQQLRALMGLPAVNPVELLNDFKGTLFACSKAHVSQRCLHSCPG